MASVVRTAAVAGSFYPADPSELTAVISKYITLACGAVTNMAVPKALVVPHAGYTYSGAIAAKAYACLQSSCTRFRRVVLIGPSHRGRFHGMALSSATAYETPIGYVPIDQAVGSILRTMANTAVLDIVHAQEHSLEVHLPFLQVVLESFVLVPIVVGNATPEEVAAVLEQVWNGPDTLVVVSTDLSHYLDYDSCKHLDAITIRAIESCNIDDIGHDQACGWVPVCGLLTMVRRRGLSVTTIDACNSGDTAGSRDCVVGYGAFAVLENENKESALESINQR